MDKECHAVHSTAAWLGSSPTYPPLFSALEFQALGLLLYTFAAYIPMCYRASLSCGASSRPNQEGGMQVRYRASLQRSVPRSLPASRSSGEFLHSFRTHLHFQSKIAGGIRNPRNPHKTNVQG